MDILLLTDRDEFEQSLSVLRVFGHSVVRAPLAITAPADCHSATAVLVDGCTDLTISRETCRRLCTWLPSAAVVAVVSAEDFAAVDLDWQVDDVLVATAGPAEAHARLRLALARRRGSVHNTLQFGDLVIHPDSYTASLSNRELDLTLTQTCSTIWCGTRVRRSPAPGCCVRSGVAGAAAARSTSTYSGCAPNSAPNTSRSSTRSAASDT